MWMNIWCRKVKKKKILLLHTGIQFSEEKIFHLICPDLLEIPFSYYGRKTYCCKTQEFRFHLRGIQNCCLTLLADRVEIKNNFWNWQRNQRSSKNLVRIGQSGLTPIFGWPMQHKTLFYDNNVIRIIHWLLIFILTFE